MNEVKLQNFVNSSGFPLQIGIQNQVEKSFDVHGWTILSREQPWYNKETGNNGFVDLVLSNKEDTQRIIVECKRVRDTKWIFLNPSAEYTERRHATFWLTSIDNNNNTKFFNWTDAAIDPPSSESEFCVVPGQDNRSKPLLERTAAEQVEATEAIAYEESQLHKHDASHFLGFYFPVIVTTAELQICSFNPNDVCIKKGEVEKCKFKIVPFVRFRKSLTTRQQSYAGKKNLKDIIRAKERTVFIVSASQFIEFIQKLEIPESPSLYKQIF
jgi:hypothetical protein